jgi:uncharacterized protein
MAEDTKFTYHFDWDPVKAQSNLANHGVSFRLGSSVLRDPLARTVFDDEHGEEEERWATLGKADNGQYLVVIHTFHQITPTEAKIRIISARRATRREVQDYHEGPR